MKTVNELAGMTDEDIKVGDWVLSLDESVDYRSGVIYRVDELVKGCIKSSTSSPHPYAQKSQRYFRKTTREEVIQHFEGVNDGVNEGVKTVSPVKTPKYKVEDRLRIVQNTTGHGFKIEEIVTVLDVSDEPRGDKGFGYGVKNDSGNYWRMHEIDAVPAEKPLTQIPKHFVVKRDNSPEWKEYIEWLNKTYNQNWVGKEYKYYGHHGANSKWNLNYKGTAGFNNPNEFKNNPQVFETAKEFMKLVNNQQPMRKVTELTDKQVIHCPTEKEAEAICKLIHEAGIEYCSGKPFLNCTNWHEYEEKTCYSPHRGTFADTEGVGYRGCEFLPAKDFLPQSFYNKSNMKRILSRTDFKRIHAVACADWKTRLAETFKDLLIQDEVVVDESYYKAMREACTPEQHKLFDEIFGEDKDKYRIKKGLFLDTSDQNLQAFCIKAFGPPNVIEIIQGVSDNKDERGRGLWLKGNWEIKTISGGVVAIPVK